MQTNVLLSISYRVLFLFFFWFAMWTVGSNIITLLSLDSSYLIVNLFASVLIIFLIITRCSNCSLFHLDSVSNFRHEREFICEFSTKKIQLFCLTLLGFLSSAIIYKYHVIWPYLICAIFILSVGWWYVSEKVNERNCLSKLAADDFNHSPFELLLLTIVICSLYYFGHQVDADDANYVNLAVGAFRADDGVFQFDTMIFSPGQPIHLPSYKAHSYELLIGTLAHLLPGNALIYAHVIVPMISCLLLSLSLYLINVYLFKGKWFLASISQIIVMIFCIDSLPSLGAHGVFRLFQGKVVFSNIVVPLSILEVIRWNLYAKPKDFLLLCALVVASVGLTANAIYIMPLALGLAVIPFLFLQPVSKQSLARLSQTFIPLMYPALIAGLIIIGGVYPSEFIQETNQAAAVVTYFGWSYFAIAALALIPLTPFFTNDITSSKYLFVYLAGIIGIVLNPLLWPLFSSVSGNLPGRILWAIPFQILLTFPVVMIYKAITRKKSNSNNWYFMVTVTLCLLGMLKLHSIQASSASTLAIDWNAQPYRVDYKNYDIAKKIVEKFGPNCSVLLPESVASNITMIENHPYPVAVRNLYLEHYRHTMSKDERKLRWQLMNSLAGENTYRITSEELLKGIKQFNIDLILIKKDNSNEHVYKKVTRDLGYNIDSYEDDYLLFFKGCK